MPRKREVRRKTVVTVCDSLVADVASETTRHVETVIGGTVTPKAAELRVQAKLEREGEGKLKLIKVLNMRQETRMYVMDEETYLSLAVCGWIDSPKVCE